MALAETGGVVRIGRNLAQLPLVARVLDELSVASGLWIEPDAAMMIAAVPLVSGRTVQAFLLTGKTISPALARNIAQVSRTEVAYLHLDGGAVRPIISTLDAARMQTFAAALNAQREIGESLAAGRPVSRLELSLDGQRWIMRINPIGDLNQGALVSAVPRQQIVGSFKAITNVLLVAGIVAIVFASILSVLAARRFLRPIERLTSIATNATRGEFPREIRVEGSGEVASLETAFNSVVADLREQRAMEQFLAELWQRVEHADISDARGETELAPVEAGAKDEDVHPVGSRLGDRYEILQCLGQGGMGVVYQVRDVELDEVVALKMLRITSGVDGIGAMKNEIRLARRITHPNVVRTFDFAQIEDHPIITMEYVRGVTLNRAISAFGCIEYFAAMRLMRQICAGLAAAHHVGVLHRDIKPANVIINYNAKVMDFGIAQPSVMRRDARNPQGSFAGTPDYVSPEQIRGENVDERADIYALGVMMFEVFTGNLPFSGDSSSEVLRAHLKQEPLQPIEFWPEIPERLNNLIMNCLAREARQRIQSVDEVLEELVEIRAG
ncbi:MAG: protein kinase [Wenzhouxiangellaceae bacterium]